MGSQDITNKFKIKIKEERLKIIKGNGCSTWTEWMKTVYKTPFSTTHQEEDMTSAAQNHISAHKFDHNS